MIEECIYNCRKLPCFLFLSFRLVPVLKVTSCNNGQIFANCALAIWQILCSFAFHVSNLIVEIFFCLLTFAKGSSFHVSQFPTSCSSLEDRCPLHHICNNETLSANRALLIGKFGALSPDLYQAKL